MSIHRFSYHCLESCAFQYPVHVVLLDIHLGVDQVHPVEPRLEFALCWNDAKGFGWVGEKFLASAILAKSFSFAKMARNSFTYLLPYLKHEF